VGRTVTLDSQYRLAVVPTRAAGAVGVLQRVAGTVAASLPVEELLDVVARLVLDGIPAARCTIFLPDATGTLVPTAVAAKRGRRRPTSLRPVRVDAALEAELFGRHQSLAVGDTASSPFRCFDPAGRSALVVPLVAGDEVSGLLVLGWDTPGRLVSHEEQELAEGVAVLVATAVRGARTARREAAKARASALVVEAAVSLNAASTLSEVLDRVQAAYADVVGAAACSVQLVADQAMRIPLRDAHRVPGRPQRSDAAAHPLRAGGGRVAVEPGSAQSPGSTVAFPLRTDDGPVGTAVVTWPFGATPTLEDLEAGQALAGVAAAAVARAAGSERLRLRLHEAEARARLSEVVAGSGSLVMAVRDVNRTLTPELGIKLGSISIANAQLRTVVGGRIPEAGELEAVRSWRAVLGKGGQPRCRPIPRGVLVPVLHRARVHGALRVSVAGGAEAVAALLGGPVEDLLLAIGAGCGELVHRAGLQQHLAASERRLAVAAERDRIAQDLHDSVGQLVMAMGMRLAQYVGDAPDKVWRARMEELLHLAGRGNSEVRQSVYALLFLEARGAALPASIRELCNKFEVTTGLPVRFVRRGTPSRLAAAKEDALFRTAHEALVNAERHARASMLTVQLAYGDDEVSLSVRDDGVGLGHRDPFGRSGHFGIRTMQRRVEEAGGALRVRNAAPRGVLVEVTIPKRKGAGARAAGTRGRRR
jgi:signal transduction histidine kinase